MVGDNDSDGFLTGDAPTPVHPTLGQNSLEVSGVQTAWATLFGVLDRPDPNFNIITP